MYRLYYNTYPVSAGIQNCLFKNYEEKTIAFIHEIVVVQQIACSLNGHCIIVIGGIEILIYSAVQNLDGHRQSIFKVSCRRGIIASGTCTVRSFTTDNWCSNSQLVGCCYQEQHKYSLGESAACGKHGRCRSVRDRS